MVAQIRQITDNQTVRTALDWTVFCIGVVSLTITIAATIVNHTADLRPGSDVSAELTTG